MYIVAYGIKNLESGSVSDSFMILDQYPVPELIKELTNDPKISYWAVGSITLASEPHWEEVEGGEHSPLDALRICHQALKELTDNKFIYGGDDSISFEDVEKMLEKREVTL